MDKKNLVFLELDGSAAIGMTITYGQQFRLLRLELHLSAAPTTSQNFTITRDSKKKTAYDVNYYTRDLSVGSVTDLVIPYGDGYEFPAKDEIDVAYTNTDARTWGIRVVLELI